MSENKIWQKRYTLVAMCFCAAFVCYIDRVNISVAAIAMKDAFGWSETEKGMVLSSFFIGYLAMQIGGGWLAHRFGGKIVLGIAVIWWSIFTILTPAAASMTFAILIVTRIFLGLGEAVAFPASFALFSVWVPAGERSRATAILLSGAPLGTVIALLTTGWLVENYGWHSAFYMFGSIGIIWAIFWFRYTVERPKDHPDISQKELGLLKSNNVNDIQNMSVPWKKLLSKSAVWALIINHLCSNWTAYMLLAWLPSYFRDAHGVSITSAGFYSAAPWLTMFIMSNAGGWFADLLLKRGKTTLFVRKLMQTGGLLGAALFLFLARDISSAPIAMFYLCGALGLLACTYSGFAPNALEIAPRYSGVLAGITNTAASIPGIVGVTLTGILVDATGTYSSAFILAAAVNIFGALVWLGFASTEPVVD